MSPAISLFDDKGRTILRDAFLAAFFFRRPHATIAAAVADAIDLYLRTIGPKNLPWFVDEHGDYSSLDAHSWQHLRGQLVDTAEWPNYTLSLDESSIELSRYRCEYQGLSEYSPIVQNRPDANSFLEFWFPPESSASLVENFVTAVAVVLPYSSGYASRAFETNLDVDQHAFQTVRDLCFEYPGLDISFNRFNSMDLGSKIRGVYWINLFGNEMVQELGGLQAFRKALPPSDFIVISDPRGAVMVQIGDEPQVGATSRGETLLAYRIAARALQARFQYSFFHPPAFLPEEYHRWIRRFLD